MKTDNFFRYALKHIFNRIESSLPNSLDHKVREENVNYSILVFVINKGLIL